MCLKLVLFDVLLHCLASYFVIYLLVHLIACGRGCWEDGWVRETALSWLHVGVEVATRE